MRDKVEVEVDPSLSILGKPANAVEVNAVLKLDQAVPGGREGWSVHSNRALSV